MRLSMGLVWNQTKDEKEKECVVGCAGELLVSGLDCSGGNRPTGDRQQATGNKQEERDKGE
jgi:hypothetical protein